MAEISVFNANQLVFLDETGGIVCTKQYLSVTGLHKPLDFLFIWLYVLRINELLGNMDIVLVGCRLHVVSDYSYARWTPRYAIISAIELFVKESRRNIWNTLFYPFSWWTAFACYESIWWGKPAICSRYGWDYLNISNVNSLF